MPPSAAWGDLEQLEQLSTQHPTRERFLTELTLDPPAVTSDQSGVASKDEDYVVLSTIHSAKGQEWDFVYVLNVADGNFPSEFSAGKPELVEEERRLLYVAMTRARNELHLCAPLKYAVTQQAKDGDAHVYGAKSRFMTDKVMDCFERASYPQLPRRRHLEPARGRRRYRGHRGCGSRSSKKCGERARSRTGILHRRPERKHADRIGRLIEDQPQRLTSGAAAAAAARHPGGLDRGARSWASFTRSGRPPIWKPFVC